MDSQFKIQSDSDSFCPSEQIQMSRNQSKFKVFSESLRGCWINRKYSLIYQVDGQIINHELKILQKNQSTINLKQIGKNQFQVTIEVKRRRIFKPCGKLKYELLVEYYSEEEPEYDLAVFSNLYGDGYICDKNFTRGGFLGKSKDLTYQVPGLIRYYNLSCPVKIKSHVEILKTTFSQIKLHFGLKGRKLFKEPCGKLGYVLKVVYQKN